MDIPSPGAHNDHMMRQTRMHHVQLSSLADMKANMLLTAASLVITLSAPNVVRPDLRWGIVVLIAFSLVTICLATWATVPKVRLPHGSGGSPPDLDSSRFNILFFGHFLQLGYEEYEAAMERVLSDHNENYRAQVRELYTLGAYLAAKKYRYLRLAYLAFIVGLALSGIVLTVTVVA